MEEVLEEECLGIVLRAGASTSRAEFLRGASRPSLVWLKYEAHMPALFLLLFSYALAVVGVILLYSPSATGVAGESTDASCAFFWSFSVGLEHRGAWLGVAVSGWFYGIATLSQLLPVWTPVLLAAAQAASASRLARSCGVLTVAPQKTALCGKVRVVAFDKTGTLTESHLGFSGRKSAWNWGSLPRTLWTFPCEGRVSAEAFDPLLFRAGLFPAPLDGEEMKAGVVLSEKAIRAMRFKAFPTAKGDSTALSVACIACCQSLSVLASPSIPGKEQYIGSGLESE